MWDIMAMFRGINAIAVDAKGRMAVPTRYREQLTSTLNPQVVLTIETEAPCLLLYPFPQWELIEQKLASLPSFNPAVRRVQRLLIGHATEVELDANGRILLPTVLRDYAKLDKKIMLVGQGNKFEIWNEDTWQGLRSEWLNPETQTVLPEELQSIAL